MKNIARILLIILIACLARPAQRAALQAPPPTITSIEPTVLPYTGGTVTVLGSNFQSGAVVRLVGRGALTTTFVNAGLLTASVPPAQPAGVYSLQVANPDGQSATLANAVTIQAAPPPTETPAPPVAGRPVLTVRNYSISPQRPYAGGTFTLRIEVYNTGSRGAENSIVKFPGGQLVTIGENAGYLLGAIGINHTRTVTQTFRVPSGLAGPASVTVLMSANDYEGNHYDFQETIALDIAGGGSGRPQLVLRQATSQPANLTPGEAYSLTLVLSNHGNASATGIVLRAAPGGVSLPSEHASTVSVDRLTAGSAITTVLPLHLSDNAAVGRQAQTIHVEYGDYSGGRYTGDWNVTLAVNADPATQPQIVIREYRTTAETLAPGNSFGLTLTLSNVGGGAAHRLVLTIGGAASATATSGLGPFAPLESSNVKFLGDLAAGKTTCIAQRFVVDGQAKAGVYQLPVMLDYQDPRGSRRSDTQIISLIVIRAPLLRVDWAEPITPTLIDQPLDLFVEIINIGQYGVNTNRVEMSSDALDITQGASTFIGPLESGTTQSVQARGIPRRAGQATLTVTVNYVDDLNRPQQIKRALYLDVQEPQVQPTPTPGESPGGGFWEWLGKLLRGLFGLGS